ncbi:hypothetical protein D3C72_1837210 [compost metagenome]
MLGQVSGAAHREDLFGKQRRDLHVPGRCPAVIQGQVTIQAREILDLVMGDDPQVDLFVFPLKFTHFRQQPK